MSFASIQRKIAALTAQMQAAVAAEDYETAARLRDAIAALRGEDEAGSPLVRQPPPGEMGLGTHVPCAAQELAAAEEARPDDAERQGEAGAVMASGNSDIGTER